MAEDLREQVDQALTAIEALDAEWASLCAEWNGNPPSSEWERDEDARRSSAADLADLLRRVVEVIDSEKGDSLRAADPEVIVMLWPSERIGSDAALDEHQADDLVLVCPRCEAVNTSLWVADRAERWCEATLQIESPTITQYAAGQPRLVDNPAAGLPMLDVFYDGSGDYEHNAYRCCICTGRVSLPDWMREEAR